MSETPEPTSVPPQLKQARPRISRREFLRRSAVVAGWSVSATTPSGKENPLNTVGNAGAIAGRALMIFFDRALASLSHTPQNEKLFSTKDSVQQLFGNVVVFVDKDGIPIKYSLQGKEFPLDKDRLIKAGQEARSSGEPVFVYQHEHPVAHYWRPEDKPKPGHPVDTELPEDVLIPDELTRRGIRITSGQTQLYMTRKVFEKGGIFEDFPETNPATLRLEIVLLDHPVMTPEALKDDKYVHISTRILDEDKLSTDHEHMRDFQFYKIAALEDALAEVRIKLSKMGLTDTVGVGQLKQEIFDLKQQLFYWHSLPQIRLRLEYMSERKTQGESHGVRGVMGGFYPPDKDCPYPIIVIPVGSARSHAYLQMYVDEGGNCHFFGNNYPPLSIHDADAVLSQSLPHLSDIPRNPHADLNNPQSYLVQGNTHVVYRFLHELGHWTQYNQGNNYSEQEADRRALAWMEQARKERGLGFFFKIPYNSKYIRAQHMGNSKKVAT